MAPLEFTAPDEPLHDFCLWEYQPQASKTGKLRPVNVLRQSLGEGEFAVAFEDMISRLRADFGLGNTVWGIKQVNGVLSWELYFYDYDRLQRSRSVTAVTKSLSPLFGSEVQVDERLPYFMFSIDVGAPNLLQAQPLKDIQLYIGNVGSSVSSGICYEVTPQATSLKNFYFFFERRSEMELIEGKMSSSAYLADPDFDLRRILWPELVSCQIIVVSNKRGHDGVYFSRVNARQLLFFLQRLAYPQQQIEFVEQNLGRLDHLLFDVGFDYRLEGGELKILKSAYYGVF